MAFDTSTVRITNIPQPVRRRAQRRSLHGQAFAPYLFLLPFGVAFVFFFLVPIGYAIYQSLFQTHRSGLGLGAPTTEFAGLSNYQQALSDQRLYEGIGRVLLFGIVQVPVMLTLALVLALLMDSVVVRLKSFFRVAFFIPYGVPGVVGALLWGFLYDPQLSPVVKGLQALGFGRIDLLNGGIVLWSIANIVTWTYTGYNMLIIFASLQSIPTQLYEAARIDGCSGLGVAWRIKIPLVAPALVLTCVLSIIGTLQLFTEPQVLSSLSHSITSTFTPNLYAYYNAFSGNNYNYTAAISVMLAIVTFVFSFGFLRLTQRQSGV